MNIIIGKRASGKTVELIKQSSLTHTPILCANDATKICMKIYAKKLGFDIKTISPNDINFLEDGKLNVNIDNVQELLESMFNIKVSNVTIDSSATISCAEYKEVVKKEYYVEKLL